MLHTFEPMDGDSHSENAGSSTDPPLLMASIPDSYASNSVVSAPPEAREVAMTAQDDAELKRNIETHELQARNKEQKQSDIELLQTTQRELDSWLQDKELNQDEYFDLKHFTKSAEVCWGERKAEDAQEDSKKTVKLFPTESAILKQKELREKLNQERSLQDEQELSLKHPLMYRRMKRNKERREVFEQALHEHKNASANESLPLHAMSPINGSYSIARDFTSPSASADRPFANVKGFSAAKHAQLQQAKPALEDKASPPKSPAQEADPAAPPVKKSLADLMKEQEEMIAAAAKHDTDVYQPILEACHRYEQQAQKRLTELSGILDTPQQPAIEQ